MTQVTGPLRDVLGNLLANTTCTIVPKADLAGQDGGATALRKGIQVTTDGSGVFDADIQPGEHILTVHVPTLGTSYISTEVVGEMAVPDDAGGVTLEYVLTTNVSEMTATILQQAIDAKDAAEAAAATVPSPSADAFLRGSSDGTTFDNLTAAQVRTALNVEDGATADQTGAEIKAAYEGEADTNAYTDSEKSKLAGIEISADVTDATNVTAAGALMDSELTNIAAVKGLDQGVATTDSPEFSTVEANGGGLANVTFESRSVAEAATVPAVVDYITVLHSDIVCDYRRASGSDPVALSTADGDWTPAGPTCTFQHFGAVSDDSTNANTAIRKALESGLTIVNRRFDTFRVTSVIVDNDANVNWTGGVVVSERTSVGASMFFRRSGATGVKVQYALRDIDFLTVNSNTNAALYIDFNPNLSSGDLGTDRHYRHLIMENVSFAPYDYDDTSQYFSARCVYLEDVHAPVFKDCSFAGPKPGAADAISGTKGVEIAGSSDPVRMDFDMCSWRSLDRGIYVSSDVEGLNVKGGSFVDVNYGVYLDPPTIGYENIAFYFNNVEFNCAYRCIYATSGSEIVVMGCTFRQHDDWGNWYGIHLADGSGAVRDFKITACTFSGTSGSSNTRNAIRLGSNVNRGRITDNFAVNVNEFCDTSAITAAKKIGIRDNHWVDETGTDQESAATQASSTTYVNTAWSY